MIKRYRALAEELMREEEAVRSHGAQTRAAKRLDIDQSTLAKIQGNDRGVGLAVVLKTIRALRLDPAYFTGKREPTTYREFIAGDPPFEAWKAFTAGPHGAKLAPEERRVLASLDLGDYEPTERFYAGVLLALQGHARRLEPSADDEPELAPVMRREAEHVEYDDRGDAAVIHLAARVRKRAGAERGHLVEPALAWLGRMRRQDQGRPYTDDEIDRALREVAKRG